MQKEERIQDWPKLIADLQAMGLSQKEIGDVVGCDQSHISDLKTGKQREPRFSIGDGLIQLHIKRCGSAANSTGQPGQAAAA